MNFDSRLLSEAAANLRTQRANAARDARISLEPNLRRGTRLSEIDVMLYGEFIRGLETSPGAPLSKRALSLIDERDALGIDITPHVTCADCKDTLFINGKPCACLTNAYKDALREKIGRVLDIDGMSFGNFDIAIFSDGTDPDHGISRRANMEMHLETCRKYACNFGKTPSSLILNGGVGTGKTFLSACIAGEVAQRGFWTVYAPAQEMFSVLEAHKFDREGSDARAAEAHTACDLLIIDDLGTEFLTPLTQSFLYTIVNTRQSKSTIINTNLTMDDFCERYAPQTVSRIMGGYELLFFFGQDLRGR